MASILEDIEKLNLAKVAPLLLVLGLIAARTKRA